jgi:hypothetical protein
MHEPRPISSCQLALSLLRLPGSLTLPAPQAVLQSMQHRLAACSMQHTLTVNIHLLHHVHSVQQSVTLPNITASSAAACW